jgi:hypothetical protein
MMQSVPRIDSQEEVLNRCVVHVLKKILDTAFAESEEREERDGHVFHQIH